MKVVINDEYKSSNELVSFLENLDTRFNQGGSDMHIARNAIKCFEIPVETLGLASLVVKRYKKPIAIQRVVYSFFRKSKAERAYLNGMKLLELGIHTPTPVAFIEHKDSGLMDYCYFVCEKSTDESLEPLILLDKPLDQDLATSLAEFFVDLHSKGIIHNDLNGGNILYHQVADSRYQFSLIDNNRMEFRSSEISIRERMSNFCKFSSETIYLQVAECYAKILGIDVEETKKIAKEVRQNFFEARAKRRAFWGKFKRNKT
ncbi:MAG: lipopolysaccharide kinase InaA family protein [Paludibacteraceae bacterium]|nr:lipopolysaccharide kinase InaA family protein [Paludibacteraceae bacterium]